MKKKLLTLTIVAVLIISFSTQSFAAVKRGGVVTVTSSKQGVLIKNFNPFSPKALYSTFGCIYETLIFPNAYSGKIIPWLAESYTWSDDLKTLTFTLRKNIKWNDGKRMDADDVVFTLNLGKKDKALDRAGIWKQGLMEVKKVDSRTVSLVFDKINTTILTQMNVLYIVPEHIWKSVEDPSKWTGNNNPVGTGAFMFEEGSFTPQSFKLKKNPKYWRKGTDNKPLPYIEGIQIVGATGNEQGSMMVTSGKVDWGTYNIPNIEKVFKKRDPKNNHYWLPGGSIVYLNLNNGKEPFSNVNLRKAVFQAVDPVEITRIMNTGAVPASQAGVNKGYLGWIPQEAKKYALSYDTTKAMKLIEGEGYKKNDKGIYEKDGKPLSFEIYIPTGWNDWITAGDVICNQLKKVGIEAKVTQNAWPSPFFDNIKTGNYDISFDYASAGFSPYYQYNNILPSRHWAPVGKESPSRHSFVRYKNETVDKEIEEYSRTADEKKKIELIGGVLLAVMRDTPLVPLFNNPTWFTYSTRKFVGWPNESNPYVAPKTDGMDKLMVYLELQPK